MTEAQVMERLRFLQEREWPAPDIEDWFGIELAQCQPLLRQYEIWLTGNPDAAYRSGDSINRSKFEIFLNSRHLMTIKAAALQLALEEACFRDVMNAAKQKGFVSDAEARGDFPNFFRSELVSEFHKRFPKLREKIFPSLAVYYDRLHTEIQRVLNVRVAPLKCPTARLFGEDDYATSLDAITAEAMSIRFKVFLDTKRPLQLRPDACSWLTYFRFESILQPCLLGPPPELTSDQQERLMSDARSQ
jgi:hypothetical protein